MKNARFLARGGMLAALTLALLFAASALPMLRGGLCAAAGILPAIALSHRQAALGAAIYVTAAILAVLIVPSKTAVCFYLVIGLYSFVKYAAEKRRTKLVQWLIKLLFAGSVYGITLLLFSAGFLPDAPLESTFGVQLSAAIVLVIGFILFILYDIAFSRVAGLLYYLFPRE